MFVFHLRRTGFLYQAIYGFVRNFIRGLDDDIVEERRFLGIRVRVLVSLMVVLRLFVGVHAYSEPRPYGLAI